MRTTKGFVIKGILRNENAISVVAWGRGSRKWCIFANVHSKVRVNCLLCEKVFCFEIFISEEIEFSGLNALEIGLSGIGVRKSAVLLCMLVIQQMEVQGWNRRQSGVHTSNERLHENFYTSMAAFHKKGQQVEGQDFAADAEYQCTHPKCANLFKRPFNGLRNTTNTRVACLLSVESHMYTST